MKSKILGKIGENFAEKYLKNKGYEILERNYKNKLGEIDIIAFKKFGKFFKKIKTLVFVEVKTGIAGNNQISPEENVHFWKQKKLIKAVKLYLKEKRINPNMPWQIDVVAVEYDELSNSARIRHIENAVWDR